MKKIVLSTIAIATLATAGGELGNMNYLAGDNSNAELEALKGQMSEMQNKIAELENRKEVKGYEGTTAVNSKAPVIEFSGKHYLGFVSSEVDGSNNRENKFETRRNYFQAKAFFAENPKDYMRITLDTHQVDDSKYTDAAGTTIGKDMDGTWNVRLKYAYLYLDEILPATGIEIGQVHRPWIDYEEHGGWNYRSISKVFVEDDNGAHLSNSADLGVDVKTKTEYFSSEFGLLNGEGYHNTEDGEGLSGEWRLSGHILGNGTEKRKKDHTYADVSFLGQYNKLNNKYKNEDLNWYGLNAVYNQPAFLLAAQYIKVDEAHADYKGKGYSVNGEYRFMPQWNLLGRYDLFEMDVDNSERKRAIAGVAYQYNKNVEFIANYLGEGGSNLGQREDALMVTAEVNW